MIAPEPLKKNNLASMKNLATVLILCLTALISVFWLSHTFQQRHRGDDLIQVTGLGKKDFTSDLIVWSGSFTQKNFDLQSAYKALRQDQESIRKYLVGKGVEEEEMLFSSVEIQKEFDYSYDQNGNSHQTFTGYRLTQRVEIESGAVEKIEDISRQVTELINSGVEFYSNSPQYFYTGLSELKIEMISAATEDARLRAEKIAENAGAELGDLRQANMGIFQIIGQHSNEDYSWGGTFNTTSKMKTATITMKLQFGVD